MEELKKCPFCGGKAEVLMANKHAVGWTIWCECKSCHARAEGYCPDLRKPSETLCEIDTYTEFAVNAWNRRVKTND